MVRALIVEEGETAAALAGCRALSRAGWHVGIGSPRPRGLASSSRFCSKWHKVPSPSDGYEVFLSAIDAANEEIPYELVFPSGDAELLALSLGRQLIKPKVPYPPHETVVRAVDKLTFLNAAADAGIRTPHTVEATEEALSKVNGQAVIKARLHSSPGSSSKMLRIEATPVAGRSGAIRRAQQIRHYGAVPLLQEFIDGRLVVHTAVCDARGRILVRVQHFADRIWPPRAGFTCRGRTMPVDRDLDKKIEVFLGSIGWFGMSQFQFLESSSGELLAIDFNGRFYASLGSACVAGVNFPAAWAAVAMERRVSGAPVGRVGVGFQDLEKDIKRAWTERRNGLLLDVLDCFLTSAGRKDVVWKLDDLRPGFHALKELLLQFVKKMMVATHLRCKNRI